MTQASPTSQETASLDALTGGAFSAPTSGERAARIRDWLATEPSAERIQEVFKEFNARDKELIAQAGKARIQQLTKEDVDAWRKAVEPVWAKFEGDIGRDLIDAALKSNQP